MNLLKHNYKAATPNYKTQRFLACGATAEVTEDRRDFLYAEIIAPAAREGAEAMQPPTLRTPNPWVGNLCGQFPPTNSAYLCFLRGFAVGQNRIF